MSGDCPPHRSPLLGTYELKRLLAKDRCNVHSNLSKALLYVPSGDLTHAPTDIASVRSFQVAGTFVGDTEPCRADALALITARLAPLAHIMRLEDCEHVHNTLQLQFHLIRMCASQIYSYWAGSMPPEQTDRGAEYSDRAISAAVAALVASKNSPSLRAHMALECAKQPSANGGLGIAMNYAATRHTRFAACFVPCWSECRRVNPDSSGCSRRSAVKRAASTWYIRDMYSRKTLFGATCLVSASAGLALPGTLGGSTYTQAEAGPSPAMSEG